MLDPLAPPPPARAVPSHDAAHAVWYADPAGSVVSNLPTWKAFTGQRWEAYQGRGWLEAVHPEDRQTLRAHWDAVAPEALPGVLGCRLRRADGVYRQVRMQLAPVHDQGVLRHWVGFVVDVTEQMAAQAELRANEERLRILDRISTTTRHAADADTIMAETTRIFGEYLGATRCAYADVDIDSDRFTIRNDWAREGVSSSAGVYSLDLFGPKATSNLRRGLHLVVNDVDAELGDDGGGRMFNAIGIKAIICAGLVKDGRLVAMMAIHQDVPRHWTAHEIQTVSDVVDRCWAHIERVRDAAILREQDARKDDFIATLAHELRNPLAPIKYAVALANRYPVPPEVAQTHAIIDRQTSLMARLIDDLLDVSRINRGLIELQPQDTQIDVLASQALESVQGLMALRGHRLEVDVPPGLEVHADPTRLVQVIANLLTNAAKYTPPGGYIVLAAHREADRILLSVRDSGLGLPRTDVGRLFHMFTQLQHTKAHSQGGLGLGLALVRKLVELHGGSVRAHSAGEGLGSTFTVELPARAKAPAFVPDVLRGVPAVSTKAFGTPAAPTPNQAVDDAHPRKASRILVVEDNDDGRASLVEFLLGLGHEVHQAADGVAAVEAAYEKEPDLVLLDLGLPRLDGYQVAQQLRARFAPERMAIIALTGWGAPRDMLRTREVGVDKHLVKPVDPIALSQMIDFLLHRLAPPP